MQEIDPRTTKRAAAFEMWMDSPMPMVTIFKTLDVTRLRRLSRRLGLKFNMLMCWCICRAASRMEEFFMLPLDKKLVKYDSLAVNTIVSNTQGGINFCDIPYSDNIEQFDADYMRLTRQVARSGHNYELSDCAIIGTSAIVRYEIDGAVNQYSGIFNNPFMVWSRYRKGLFKTTLKVSFQFHHVQMDGEQAARFLYLLQQEIDSLLK